VERDFKTHALSLIFQQTAGPFPQIVFRLRAAKSCHWGPYVAYPEAASRIPGILGYPLAARYELRHVFNSQRRWRPCRNTYHRVSAMVAGDDSDMRSITPAFVIARMAIVIIAGDLFS
jgi:hypothetical protein